MWKTIKHSWNSILYIMMSCSVLILLNVIAAVSRLFHMVVTNYIATFTSFGDVIHFRHALLDFLLLAEWNWDSTVPWLRQSVISLSPQRSRFGFRPVGHRVNSIVLAQNFLHVLWFFPVTVILPLLHTHLLIYQWHCIILVTNSVMK